LNSSKNFVNVMGSLHYVIRQRVV